MIHNSFRRIALAQGLLPVRNYLPEIKEPDLATDLATLVAFAAGPLREPLDGATQV